MKTFSRRDLYAFGEPIGESSTRAEAGRRVYGGGGGGDPFKAIGDAVGNVASGVGHAVDSVGGSLNNALTGAQQGVTNTLNSGMEAMQNTGSSVAPYVPAAIAMYATYGAYEPVDGGTVWNPNAVNYSSTPVPGATALDAAGNTVGTVGSGGSILGAGSSGAGLGEAGVDYLSPSLGGLTGGASIDPSISELGMAAMDDGTTQGILGSGALTPEEAALGAGAEGNAGSAAAQVGASGASNALGLTDLAKAGLGNSLSSWLKGNLGGTGLTGAGALAGLGGLAGLMAMLNADKSNYGVPGRASYVGPLNQFKYSPGAFQPMSVNPNAFRPQGGAVTTVADQLAQLAQAKGMAQGGKASSKPTYTTKSQLGAMNPWERALAEYNNAAYKAQSPTGVQAAPAGIGALGQLNLKHGGSTDLGSYSDGGRMLKGPGDGMSDSIPASISGKRPARLADGEFVVPADVVSHLGNGSTEAGARQLYQMMDRIRQARTGRKAQGKQINPGKFMPK